MKCDIIGYRGGQLNEKQIESKVTFEVLGVDLFNLHHLHACV